ncbi:MAG: ABC transporter ATP-binding protein [Bacteroidetes bacterium]|nr:ABC transporter ATP-binding protein [Bacteroidota bacterium]
MKIILENIGRKYNYEWIFRSLDFEFESGNAYAILGSNGSGKSTLLQIISGHLHPSTGKINYHLDGKVLEPDDFFRHVSYSGPYLELLEEFTLSEMVRFHHQFKKFRNNMDEEAVIKATTLTGSRNKPIKYFSSGMKQRVKLALAILSNTPLVLLDEPTSNLDQQGIDWFRELLLSNREDRIVIVCSNSQAAEHDFCKQEIVINDYKK